MNWYIIILKYQSSLFSGRKVKKKTKLPFSLGVEGKSFSLSDLDLECDAAFSKIIMDFVLNSTECLEQSKLEKSGR